MQYQVKNPYNSKPAQLTEINELDFKESPKRGFVTVPFSSQRVSCGLFGIVNDHVENYQSLDERFVKNKASTYFFEAESDSMSPLILEKDILIVDRALESHSDCIVVCSLNGEMLCKRLIEKSGKLYLFSENQNYKPIELCDDSDFTVFGVVRGIAREFKAL